MLSYRHAFHAGNHGDVLKHMVLVEVLCYLNQKDKPYCYVDTHAGAGLYSLTQGYATQNAEYETGIGRLWERRDLPPMLARYVEVVKSFQQSAPGSTLLRFYPGSPLIAQRLLRPTDSLRLFEAHPADCQLLQDNMRGVKQSVVVNKGDGFAGLKAVLPPPTRRGLILIDPPYEVKRDYRDVVEALKEAIKRFATGTYIVWYPCLRRAELPRMQEALNKLPFENTLNVELMVQKPAADGFGMYGSGLFIANPPWTLEQSLRETLPYLKERLGVRDQMSGIRDQKTDYR